MALPLVDHAESFNKAWGEVVRQESHDLVNLQKPDIDELRSITMESIKDAGFLEMNVAYIVGIKSTDMLQGMGEIANSMNPSHLEKGQTIKSAARRIKKFFINTTFDVEIKEIDSDLGRFQVSFTREGKLFMDSISLESVSDALKAIGIQTGSIIIEIVLAVLSMNEIEVAVNNLLLNRTLRNIETLVHTPSFREAIDIFISAWSKCKWTRAKACFRLLQESYSAGILFVVIKSLLSDMESKTYLRTVAKVMGMLAVEFKNDGSRIIATICLALVDDLGSKNNMLKQMSVMKECLPKIKPTPKQG